MAATQIQTPYVRVLFMRRAIIATDKLKNMYPRNETEMTGKSIDFGYLWGTMKRKVHCLKRRAYMEEGKLPIMSTLKCHHDDIQIRY